MPQCVSRVWGGLGFLSVCMHVWVLTIPLAVFNGLTHTTDTNNSNSCQAGCGKVACYGQPGGPLQWCTDHRGPGDIPRCIACNDKQPSFGPPGCRPMYCSECRLPGDVVLRVRKMSPIFCINLYPH